MRTKPTFSKILMNVINVNANNSLEIQEFCQMEQKVLRVYVNGFLIINS